MTYTEGAFLPRDGALLTVQVAVNPEFEDYLRDSGQVVPPPESALALIDSGADITLVSAAIISKFVLPVMGKTLIEDSTGHAGFYSTYDVRLTFPHGSAYTITVAETPHSHRSSGRIVECLIGCDVLAFGTFLYDGPHGKFRLTI
jgi:hypothetical protein